MMAGVLLSALAIAAWGTTIVATIFRGRGWTPVALGFAVLAAAARLGGFRLEAPGEDPPMSGVRGCSVPTVDTWLGRSYLETLAVVGPLVVLAVVVWRSRAPAPRITVDEREVHDYRTPPRRERLVLAREPFTWMQRLTLGVVTATAIATVRETARDAFQELVYAQESAKLVTGTYDGEMVYRGHAYAFRLTLQTSSLDRYVHGDVDGHMAWADGSSRVHGHYVENHALLVDQQSPTGTREFLCDVKNIYRVGDELIGTDKDGTASLRAKRVTASDNWD